MEVTVDAILISPEGQGLVIGLVHRYKDPKTGEELQPPDTLEERLKQPSDHAPVEVELDLQEMLKRVMQIPPKPAF